MPRALLVSFSPRGEGGPMGRMRGGVEPSDTKQKRRGFHPGVFRFGLPAPYSAATILPSSHLKSEKLCEVRSPLSP